MAKKRKTLSSTFEEANRAPKKPKATCKPDAARMVQVLKDIKNSATLEQSEVTDDLGIQKGEDINAVIHAALIDPELVEEIISTVLKGENLLSTVIKTINLHLKDLLKNEKQEVIKDLYKMTRINVKNQKLEDLNDTWTVFVRKTLKFGLGLDHESAVKAEAIKSLRILTRLVYENVTAKQKLNQVVLMFDMISGHSAFMELMLDPSHYKSPVKCEVIELAANLMKLQPTLCRGINFPIFLGAYNGHLSPTDWAILKVLSLYSKHNEDAMIQCYPMTWGQKAVEHYCLRQKDPESSLWKRPKVSEILSQIQVDRMTKTCLRFPLALPLTCQPDDERQTRNDEFEKLYDPRFFLPLGIQICAPGSFVDRHLKLIECGMLQLGFSALSSRDLGMRKAGYLLITRIYHQLERAKLTAEKKIWLHLLDTFKNGVKAANGDVGLRVPSVVTVFLVRTCFILQNPLHFMYKTVTGFILAKPALDLFNVPEFFRLFHNSEVIHIKKRDWMLETLRDGLRDDLDFHIAQKSFMTKMLMSYSSSILCNKTSRTLIYQVIHKIVHLVQPAFDLVKKLGVNQWLAEQLVIGEEQELLVSIAIDCLQSLQRSLSVDTSLPLVVTQDFRLLFAVIKSLPDLSDEIKSPVIKAEMPILDTQAVV